MRIKDDFSPHLRWCHNGWASNILIVVDTYHAGIHYSKYWMTIHYDTIEDGQVKKSNFLFSKCQSLHLCSRSLKNMNFESTSVGTKWDQFWPISTVCFKIMITKSFKFLCAFVGHKKNSFNTTGVTGHHISGLLIFAGFRIYLFLTYLVQSYRPSVQATLLSPHNENLETPVFPPWQHRPL